MALIDKFIEQAEGSEHQKAGGNKKCWLFPAHALLRGSCKPEEVEETMKRQDKLLKEGVNVVPIVAYKPFSDKDDLGFQKAYFLQRKAKGEELHSSSNSASEYKNNLSNLAQEKQELYDKFVTDWIKIDEAGLKVDPSKSTNFFHEKGKQISFIDLDLRSQVRDKDWRFTESCTTVLGGGKYWQFGGEINSECQKNAGEILNKLKLGFIKNGYNEKELDDVIKDKFYKAIPNYKEKEDIVKVLNSKNNEHDDW